MSRRGPNAGGVWTTSIATHWELPGAGADRERGAPDEGHAPGVAERTEHGGAIAGRLGEVRVHQ